MTKPIVILLYSLLFLSCSSVVNQHDSEALIIKCDPDKVVRSMDSIVKNVSFVPLETTDECLIGDIFQIEFTDSLILINTDVRRALLFNRKGKFLREIGTRGGGPTEYTDIRDVYIKDTIIEMLHYKKIQKYSTTGKYLGKKTFDFSGKDFHCQAIKFAPCPLGGYYLWGGTTGITRRIADKNHFMHQVDEDMNIVNSYFPITHGDGGHKDVFNEYENRITLDPTFGEYNIYQIDSLGEVSVRYGFDFGKYSYSRKEPFEITYENISNYKSLVLEVSNFVETKKWVHINYYLRSMVYRLFYNKETKKLYNVAIKPEFRPKQDFIVWSLNNKAVDDRLVTVIEASHFIYEKERLGAAGRKKYNLEKYDHITEDDNPIICFYELR